MASFVDKISLKSINLSIKKGEFVAIIGEVGSGKSSLLSSILGDMLFLDEKVIEKYKDVNFNFNDSLEEAKSVIEEINQKQKELLLNLENVVSIGGRMSLVEQKPFILNKTIRDNILFGEELDTDRYNKVIRICQLERDLKILDGGDLTEIGERGINLSGGQKARVSIARAVYANSDIILMDDPLSALDAHVKRKIFNKVCWKELVNKTRLLVTHSVEFLDRVDRIIVIEKGIIILNGSFEELKHEEYFSNILLNMSKIEKKSNSSKCEVKDINDKIKEQENLTHGIGTKIIDEEDKEEIKYGLFHYMSFIKSAFVITLFILSWMVASRLIVMKKEYFLIQWIKDFSQNAAVGYNGIVFIIILSLSWVAIDLARSLLEVFQNFVIDKKLFSDMINKLLNASIPLFFDKTSSGSILNKFTYDIDVWSQELPEAITNNIKEILMVIITIWIVAYNAFFWVLLIPISGILFVYTIKEYVNSSKQIKNIWKIANSPIMTHINETIDGDRTIRTLNKTFQFEDKHLDL